MKESKKRRRKQPGQIDVSFTAGQFARCPAFNEPPALTPVWQFCVNFWAIFGHFGEEIFFSERIG